MRLGSFGKVETQNGSRKNVCPGARDLGAVCLLGGGLLKPLGRCCGQRTDSQRHLQSEFRKMGGMPADKSESVDEDRSQGGLI